MTSNNTKSKLAHAFHQALTAKDWSALQKPFHDDATWTLPGDNRMSGTAEGVDAVVKRAKLIASFGLNFEFERVLYSRDHMALSLHNTAERDGVILDEYLATVCRIQGDRIIEIETFLSDVPGMSAFFG